VAWRSDSLRAAAKLSTQANWNTRAPKPAAISRVRSVEPVSTTMISSTRSVAEARQSGRFASSSLTIMHSETRIRRAGASRRTGRSRSASSRRSTESAACSQVRWSRTKALAAAPLARASSGWATTWRSSAARASPSGSASHGRPTVSHSPTRASARERFSAGIR